MSPLDLSIHWNPRNVGSNASTGMGFLEKWKQAGKEPKPPSSMPDIGCMVEGRAQVRGGWSQDLDKSPVFSSQIWIRSDSSQFELNKNPSQMCPSILGV